MVVEQEGKCIEIHLDNYVKEVVAEYSGYIKTSLRPKKVPIFPGVAFKSEDVPDPTKQKHYRSFIGEPRPLGHLGSVRITQEKSGYVG